VLRLKRYASIEKRVNILRDLAEKLHYNAVFGGDFGRNCIIVQFLERGKERKGKAG
jgi:hypothetical protein